MRTNAYRTHVSSAVTEEIIGQDVRVAGWVENIRDHGGVKFLDIRDHYGVVQAVVYDEALLEPVETIQGMERGGDRTSRLAWTQEFKAKPFGLVWDYYCESRGCGLELEWLNEVKKYESAVALKR